MKNINLVNSIKKTESLVKTEDYNGPTSPLIANIEFIGESGKTYIILSNEFVYEGGESILYMCIYEKRKYVAKILNISVSPRNDTLREPVIEFLLKNSGCKSHLLQLIDYGIMKYYDGKYETQKYVEIYPFCPKGDMGQFGKVEYDTLCKKVIPAVSIALKTMHDAKLVHRDIKPNNIYEINNEFYVGDFGLLTSSDDNIKENLHAYTDRQRGTPGYVAPEVNLGSVYSSSDYYSFGQTISTLYHGKHMYEHLINNSINSNKANRDLTLQQCMIDETLYINLKEEHMRLDILLKGLLRYKPNDRFGYELVERWLRGDDTLVIPEKGNIHQLNPPFVIENVECKTYEDMANQLLLNWKKAQGFLYEGIIKEFLARQNTDLSMKAHYIVKNEIPSKNSKDIGLSKFIFYLTKGNEIYWRGKKYNSYSEMFTISQDESSNESEIIDLITSRLLTWRLEQMEDKDNKIKDQILIVHNIELVIKDYPQVGYHYARYKFTNKKIKYDDCSSIYELVKRFIKVFSEVDSLEKLWLEDNAFYGFLMSLGYVDIALKLYMEVRNSTSVNRIRALFRVFETIIEANDTLLSDFKLTFYNTYIFYGPRSYLSWIKYNLSCYNFIGWEAKRLEKDIGNIRLQNNDKLTEIDSSFDKLDKLLNEFDLYFCDNPHLSILGISNKDGNNIIISKGFDGYFLADFYDRKVPVGFKKYIDLYNKSKK